jgi:hypothetical protein
VIRQVHRGLLCCLLVAVGAWFGYAGWLTRQPLFFAAGLLALAALRLAMRGSRFARYPVIALALLLSAEWLTAVILSIRIGYFGHQSPSAVVLALLPGLAMEVAAAYAIIVAVACCPGSPRG